MKKMRTLKPSEIEVRVQSVKNGKANMLLYIDSRAVTELLDETYGMENWNFEFKEAGDKIFGRLSIYDIESNRWVYREDIGSESNIEADKGFASDCYKRCLVRFGMTELYSSPKITITDDGFKCSGYKVSEITYNDNREITHLVIVNRFGKEAFRWDEGNVQSMPQSVPVASKTGNVANNASIAEQIRAFCSSKKVEEGVNLDELKKFFEFYTERANTWKFSKFNGSTLWTKWMERAS